VISDNFAVRDLQRVAALPTACTVRAIPTVFARFGPEPVDSLACPLCVASTSNQFHTRQRKQTQRPHSPPRFVLDATMQPYRPFPQQAPQRSPHAVATRRGIGRCFPLYSVLICRTFLNLREPSADGPRFKKAQ
jgi:hypothetical protein